MADPADRAELHPAEHRAYRELYLISRQLLARWRRLGEFLADSDLDEALAQGASEVEWLLEDLEPRTAAWDLHGGPAAQVTGKTLGDIRSALLDRAVDTGLAARMAVLDIEHVVTLLLQLAELAKARGDAETASFCEGWASRLRIDVRAVRRAAVALGRDADRTAAPLDRSALGEIIHRAGWAVGTVGEWLDRRLARISKDREDR